MIIDNSYFRGELNLPQVGNNILKGDVDRSIDFYEANVLRSLLGYDLYTLFIAGLEADTPDQRWLDLRDGASFTFSVGGRTYTRQWEGLANTRKVSLIAYYVYYHYRNEVETPISNTGQARAVKENSQWVDYKPFIIKAYNKGVDLYGQIPTRLRPILRRGEYYNYFADVNNYQHWDSLPSAYNYLLANKDTYLEWEFTPLWKLNNFGL